MIGLSSSSMLIPLMDLLSSSSTFSFSLLAFLQHMYFLQKAQRPKMKETRNRTKLRKIIAAMTPMAT